MPKVLALQVPVYAGYSKSISTPQYDPDLGSKLKDKLRTANKPDSIRRDAVDELTIKTINLPERTKPFGNKAQPRYIEY